MPGKVGATRTTIEVPLRRIRDGGPERDELGVIDFSDDVGRVLEVVRVARTLMLTDALRGSREPTGKKGNKGHGSFHQITQSRSYLDGIGVGSGGGFWASLFSL